jgi:Mlc titration factor MtfA (ptsG expression regulator)
MNTPISPASISILEARVHLYKRLPAELRAELHGHVNVFLDEKNFVGCNGQEISDEVRLTIAGYACLLLLGRRSSYFPGFTSVLVYPDTFVSSEVSYDGLVEVHEESHRAGESWHRGPVVLSWKDIEDGAASDDGFNVVLHEFAHKLDEEDSETDGVPRLHDDAHYDEWAEVLAREFGALEERVIRGRNHVLDEYGLSSPPEFFAVATESFFEKPTAMQASLPDLYVQLRKFYRVDPAVWGRD